MKVFLTGGTGAVGKAVVARLVEHGYEVLVAGRRAGMELAGADYAVCDVSDYEAVRETIRGCDLVVHLAAMAQPGKCPAPQLFEINCGGTFNVFEAAAREGIGRVVQASSINSLGCYFNIHEFEPRYFPIDEEHPVSTTDPYSFSKNVVESIADYFWRRDGISSVSLRLPGVWTHRPGRDDRHRRYAEHQRAVLDDLMSLPENERRRRIDTVRRWSADYRARRPFDYGFDVPSPADLDCPDLTLFSIYCHSAYNLWVAVDERDSAQAIHGGLEADYEGSHVLFINHTHNTLGYDSRTLADLFFPDVTTWKQEVRDSEALVSVRKARELIGFVPEFPLTDL